MRICEALFMGFLKYFGKIWRFSFGGYGCKECIDLWVLNMYENHYSIFYGLFEVFCEDLEPFCWRL